MYIGIDLGGTNVAGAIVGKNGEILKRAEIPTATDGGAKSVVDGLVNVCKKLLDGDSEHVGASPLAIGIGVPGAVNNNTGEVIFTPNLHISGVNIVSRLRDVFTYPVYLGNDANCAALGEVIAGGARGARSVVFVTLGTGVGGGIVFDGRLYTGINEAAGELGHIVIFGGGRECSCGRLGCWERYASATGLRITAEEFMGTQKDSLLWELCGGNSANLDGRMIFDAYRAGDNAAMLTIEQYVEHLAMGIIDIINIFEPEMICLGGGISNSWDCLEEPLNVAIDAQKYMRYAQHAPQTRLVKAALGNDAGIIGAAMLGIQLSTGI